MLLGWLAGNWLVGWQAGSMAEGENLAGQAKKWMSVLPLYIRAKGAMYASGRPVLAGAAHCTYHARFPSTAEHVPSVEVPARS